MACVEFGRNVVGLEDAGSAETNPDVTNNIIDLMADQENIENLGGTLRLGLYPCKLKKGTKTAAAYGNEDVVQERHRHRYEFNNIVSLCYLTYNTYGNWSFALALRGKKLLAFIFVGIAAAFSTISFQTVTQNHFLTPNILGMDSLYVSVQTVLFFLLGGAQALGQVSLGSTKDD